MAPDWWCASLALRLVGAVPERISIRHQPSGKPLDAVVIGGGSDVGPEHYGGDIHERIRADPERDLLEIDWIRRAIRDRIPILGICRGAQLINIVMGGNLLQDIREIRVRTHNRPGLLPTKQVRLESGSMVHGICGHTRIRVNSLHSQAVDSTGEGLRAVGHDLDDIVQAIESEAGWPIVGVQWHPEYLLYLPSQLALFRWLVSQVIK